MQHLEPGPLFDSDSSVATHTLKITEARFTRRTRAGRGARGNYSRNSEDCPNARERPFTPSGLFQRPPPPFAEHPPVSRSPQPTLTRQRHSPQRLSPSFLSHQLASTRSPLMVSASVAAKYSK